MSWLQGEFSWKINKLKWKDFFHWNAIFMENHTGFTNSENVVLIKKTEVPIDSYKSVKPPSTGVTDVGKMHDDVIK